MSQVPPAPSSSPSSPLPGASSDRLSLCFASVNASRVLLGETTGFGGAEVELVNLATQLAREPGVAVSLVTVTAHPGDFPPTGMRILPVDPTPPDIARHGFLARKLLVIAFWRRLARSLLYARPSAYFCKLASDEAVLVFFVSRLSRRPFCFRVEHDWELEPAAIQANIFAGSRIRTLLFTTCLKMADVVICQTEKQRAALRANYDLSAVIVNNAHRMPELPSPRPVPAERRPILWIARAHPMKRPALFLELARRHPDLPFMMVMAPDPASEQLCRETEQEAAALPNVTYVPGLPQDQVAELYRSARAFVLTSDAEGYANTVIEALKWGTPVLSLLLNFDSLLTEVPVAPSGSDIISAAAGGYCAGGDFEALVSLTGRLASDDSFWEECSRAARVLAEENFDVEKIAPRYVELFRKVVAVR